MKKLGPLLLIAGSLGLAPLGCVRSDEPDIKLASTPDGDPDYARVLDKATQERTVYKDFETRFRLSATYLSPEFRSAFGKRLQRVYQEGATQFEEASAKAGFFVSLAVPDADATDLNNPQHWSILLGAKDGPLKPVLVKRLDDKERWRAFFRTVDPWTTEYLVLFDAPSVNANSPELVEKTPVTVTFANADAQVKLSW